MTYYRVSFRIFLLWALLTCGQVCGQEIYRVDPLALLSGTLRTYQRAGCDDDIVTLKCPHGTSISIQVAQYGKSAPTQSLCPSKEPPQDTDLQRTGTGNTSCFWPNALQTKWQQVEEGTWGRTVVEACQKKRQCKFQTSPKAFGGDPCPGVRKYVEVAYKCRPYEFRSKVACENDVIHLKCNPNSRIAVYSSSYGRTEYESIQCPQPQGVPEETCLVSYATETVMQICHGKRRCTLSADAATFGNPCRPESRMYLKVVYTCVPRKVLKERFEGPPEEDEPPINENDDDDDFYDEDQFFKESAAIPPAPNLAGGHAGDGPNATRDPADSGTTSKPMHARTKDPDQAALTPRPKSSISRYPYNPTYPINPFYPSRRPSGPYTPPTYKRDDKISTQVKDMQGDVYYHHPGTEEGDNYNPNENDINCTTVSVVSGENTKVIGYISQWINAYMFVAQNQERFYLYLVLSITAGVLLCLGLVIGRLLLQRHRSRRDSKLQNTTVTDHTLPNGFADDISEIDADIDLTTPLPMPLAVPAVAIHSPTRHEQVAEVVRYGSGGTYSPSSVGPYTHQMPNAYGPVVHTLGGSIIGTHGHTLRRGQSMQQPPMDLDNNAPRSLNRGGNTQYYYG